MSEMKAGSVRYLRFVLAEKKLTPNALAELAGVASTTLSRAIKDGHRFGLSIGTIEKIKVASGIDPLIFFTAEPLQKNSDNELIDLMTQIRRKLEPSGYNCRFDIYSMRGRIR